MKVICKILAVLFFSTTLSFGQVIDVTDLYSSNKYFFPNFEHLGENTGLPHYRISSLIEDHEGYVWIGTRDGGLIKYDGYDFESFEFKPEDPFSIPSNEISFIYEDSRKMLWIGTDNALCYYHPFENKFLKIPLAVSDSKSEGLLDIFCITEDLEGNLFIGTNGGIFQVSNIDESKVNTQKNPVINNDSVNIQIEHILLKIDNKIADVQVIKDLSFDSKGIFWVLRNHDLGTINSNHISSSSISSEIIKLRNYNILTPTAKAYQINPDEPGKVWVNTTKNLLHITYDGKNYTINKFSHKQLLKSADDFSNNYQTGKKLWAGLEVSDIELFDKGSSSFFPLTFETRNTTDLYDHGVSCLLRTKSNVIFIGTIWGGLYKFNPNAVFSYFHPHLQNVHLNQTNNLRFVLQDSQDNLWLIAKELYKCNRYTGEVLETYSSAFFKKHWTYKNKLLEDDHGKLWVATEGAGIYILENDSDRKSNHLTSNIKNLLSGYTITSIHKDKNGNIWAGTTIIKNADSSQTELFKINHTGSIIDSFLIRQWPQSSGLQNDEYIFNIYTDNEDNTWLATGFGLIVINEHTREKLNYNLSKSSLNSLGKNKILSLCPDPNYPGNILWIGTSGGGLYTFNLEDKTFQNIADLNELPSKHISSILSDDNGNLWVATDKGISCLVMNHESGDIEKVQTFDQADGLITTDFTYYYGHSGVKTKNGELIFTGPRGFQIISPDNINIDKTFPEAYIGNIRINYKPADYGNQDSPLKKPISKTKSIELDYDQNTLGFDVSVLDFKSPKKLGFAFKLINYDLEWVYNETDRTIQYTKLPPGTYQLNLRTKSQEGVWRESEEVLKIRIQKPWWLSYYAYGIYLFIIILGIWIFHRSRLARQKMKMKIELSRLEAQKFKELDSMKSMFFANISHEFRTPLTLIMSPIDNLLKKVSDPTMRNSLIMMQRNTGLLEQYINEILDLSKLEANKLSLKTSELDIVMYTKFLFSSFESRAGQKNISLHFSATQKKILCYFDQERANSMLTNLFSNAIKYTPTNGRIDVNLTINFGYQHPNFSPQNGCVEISVKNTGAGISGDKLPYIFDRYYRVDNESTEKEMGTGLGLTLVRELVHLHKGIINVMSKENEFTVFIVRLPLGHQHLKPEEIDNSNAKKIDYNSAQSGTTKIQEVSVKDNEDSKPDKKIVLVIDDSEDMRTLVKFGLQEDYKVIEAEDGEEGEKIAIKTCPDLIICDVSMPKKEGFEMAKDLKTNEVTSHIPIILLTGRAEQSDKIAGLETGVDAYLTKPFHTKELKIRVNNLLEQREKLKEKYSRQNILKLNSLHEKSIDQVFLEKVIKAIETHLAEEDFSVQVLMNEIGVSRTQLHRKLKALLNQSANELIQSIRMQKASEMLKNKSATIAEIAYLVGFSSPPYFSRAFKQHFGHSPSEHNQSQS